MPIDTVKASAQYRARTIDRVNERVLMTRLNGSTQEMDLTSPVNCGGLGRIRHFRRETSAGWPENSLPIDPAAHALGLGGRLEMIEALVFQNAACNWRCWYCFVPFNRLSADERYSEWASMEDLVSLYAQLEKMPPVLDLSGGQPELTPEMTLWMMRALRKQTLEQVCFLWSDDNLSEEYFWSKLSDAEQSEIVSYDKYARVGCFKGFDDASFAFNTMAGRDQFDHQFAIMERSIASGLKMYAYTTFTTPERDGIRDSMGRFVDRLQTIHHNLPLRTVPLEVRVFTPTSGRIKPEHLIALEAQREAIDEWNYQISRRFSSAERECPVDVVALN